MRSSRWVSLTIVAMLLPLAACGSHSADRGVASLGASTGTPTSNPVAFEKCMSDNGAPMQSTAQGTGLGGAGTVNDSGDPGQQLKAEQALAKCRQYLPVGGVAQPMSPQQLDVARAIAKCMRAAGFDYPDPDPTAAAGNGTLPIPPGINLNDSSTVAKLQACQAQSGFGQSASPGTGR